MPNTDEKDGGKKIEVCPYCKGLGWYMSNKIHLNEGSAKTIAENKMQTVKIGDVEYPWPEECKAFNIDERGFKWFLVYKRGISTQAAVMLDDEKRQWVREERDFWLPIIASVAAMHFRLKAEQQYDLALTLRDEAAARHAGQIGRMWEDAYDKWAKLAKGV